MNKLAFNTSLVIGTASIILLVASIIYDQPILVLSNTMILAASIIWALISYKERL